MSIQGAEARTKAGARGEAAAMEGLPGLNRPLYEHNRAQARGLWPELSDFDAAWVARVATDLGLDILRREVTWLEGRPYIATRGLLRLLNRHPQFDNYELAPVSEEVRRAMRATRDDEQVWVCRVWRKDRTRPAIGYSRATPDDTAVGYGQARADAPQQSGESFKTPAVAEMAQERALRHAVLCGFAWDLPGKTNAQSGPEVQTPNDAGDSAASSTPAQRRCIHALARALELPEGELDVAKGAVVAEGWRADLYRLYGVGSTTNLTATQAGEFIEALCREHPELDERGAEEQQERRELWRRVKELLAELPSETPAQVSAWLQIEHGAEVRAEEFQGDEAPSRAPTAALRRVAQGLQVHRDRLVPES